MSLLVLAGVFIDKSIRTTGRYCGSEDPFSFFSGPFAGFLADAEGLDCTGCNGRANSLGHFLLTLTASTLLVMRAAAGSATGRRWRNRVRFVMTTGATTTMVPVSVIVVIISRMVVTVSSMMAVIVIIVVSAAWSARALLDGGYAGRMSRVGGEIAIPMAVAVVPVVVVVGGIAVAGDGVAAASAAGDDVHGAVVGRGVLRTGVAITGRVVIMAVVVCHFVGL